MNFFNLIVFIVMITIFRYIFSVFGKILGWIISLIPSLFLYVITDSIFGYGILNLTFTEILGAIFIANLLNL